MVFFYLEENITADKTISLEHSMCPLGGFHLTGSGQITQILIKGIHPVYRVVTNVTSSIQGGNQCYIKYTGW